MKIKYKRQMLRAINKLIKHYKSIPLDSLAIGMGDCPLCVMAREIKRSLKGELIDYCSFCPWVLFEDTTCYATKSWGYTNQRRIERLERWKKIIKENS